jgi:hypothetical protein
MTVGGVDGRLSIVAFLLAGCVTVVYGNFIFKVYKNEAVYILINHAIMR